MNNNTYAYRHKYFGGQLSKSNKLIQLNDIPDYFNFLISRFKENDIEDAINYIELFSLSGGQELNPSNKHTTITLALRSHQMVKVDNYQLLLEPRSLLLIKDDGPPDIIKGHDRCLNPPPLILNRNLLSIEPYTEFTKSGGELKRTNGFIINFYKIEHILKSLNKLIK